MFLSCLHNGPAPCRVNLDSPVSGLTARVIVTFTCSCPTAQELDTPALASHDAAVLDSLPKLSAADFLSVAPSTVDAAASKKRNAKTAAAAEKLRAAMAAAEAAAQRSAQLAADDGDEDLIDGDGGDDDDDDDAADVDDSELDDEDDDDDDDDEDESMEEDDVGAAAPAAQSRHVRFSAGIATAKRSAAATTASSSKPGKHGGATATIANAAKRKPTADADSYDFNEFF